MGETTIQFQTSKPTFFFQVTNNVVSSDKGGKSASLGRAWSHVPHVRVLIGHLNDDLEQTVRTASVVKNSRGVRKHPNFQNEKD